MDYAPKPPRKGTGKYILLILLLLGAVGAGLWAWLRANPGWPGKLQLTMNGQRTMTIEYGQPYTEPGVNATYGNVVSVPVETDGEVDSDALGSYRLKYTATHNGHIVTGYRQVLVTDTTPPEIHLTTTEGVYTEPGQPYEEEGFTAVDNYDGDVTQQVVRQEQNGVVTYTVTDSHGNQAVVTRMIRYHDYVAPELMLNGSTHVAIHTNDRFEDPGATAADDRDGDLTDRITVEGTVNNSIPGVYSLRYKVSDEYGNETSAIRTVCVLQDRSTEILPPNGKVIYLTFDDGPGKYTGQLLDILEKYNVKATFFVIDTYYLDELTRIAQEGHVVAIHSKTHRFNKIYASEKAFFNDLYAMQDIIRDYTGTTATLMRFPGGSSNTVSRLYNRGIMSRLVESVAEAGFRYFDWNVDSDDAGSSVTSRAVYQNVITGVAKYDESVVLMHDIFDYTLNAVEDILLWGITNGYRFEVLTNDSPQCEHGTNN